MPGHCKQRRSRYRLLIVYGIKGSQNDVDSAVYDTAYIVENSKMVLQTELDMNGNFIRKLKSPSFDDDAVNKKYVEDNYLSKNGGVMTYNISMNNNKITNLGLPTFDKDATNKKMC